MSLSLLKQRLIFRLYQILLISGLIQIVSCTGDKTEIIMDENAPVFTLLKSRETGIDFTNRSIERLGRNLGHYDYFYNGSGVAIGDLNNDGFADVFFAGNDIPNRLYINEGDFKFKNISKEAGFNNNKWATGVSMVDINDDGFLDIYVCYSGPLIEDNLLSNELYINNGDLTFTESASQYGIADTSRSSQATFFDMDRDGDLDLFVMNHSIINYGKSIQEWERSLSSKDLDEQKKSCNTLYRNDGNGNFTDITVEAGLFRAGFGLGVSISDFDENGFLDIYVANDYFIPDFMYMNLGNGTFVDGIKERMSHSSFYGMGCDAADFNNDGLIDLAVVDMTPADHYRGKTQMESMDPRRFEFLVQDRKYIPQYMFNTLNLNRVKGNFSEIANLSGIAKTDWSWAPLFLDLDNDSWKDLVITNGFKRDTKDRDWANELKRRFTEEGRTDEVSFDQIQKAKSTPVVNYIYKNNGDLSFDHVSKDWGFNEPSFSQGAAYGDLDNDGDLDMVINNLEQEAFVYRNNSSEQKKHHYIQFVLDDNGKSASVRHTKIKVYTKGTIQIAEYSFDRGYLSGMEPLAHFGLGTNQIVDKVEFYWPNGRMSTIIKPEIDKKHHVDKSKQSLIFTPKKEVRPLFVNIANQAKGLNFKHIENNFNDFENEILLPHKQSTLGPSLAVGDINGDGLVDFYVGGAKGQAGQLYIQDQKLGLVLLDQQVFINDKKYEDLGALFFDVDMDGDMDLYVSSGGGGDFAEATSLMQDRLYINAGDGKFNTSNKILPKITSSTATVAANDWDKDGDLDLFVGGRTTPGKYPEPPNSYLLENRNGVFTDITDSYGPELRKAGMITSSSWTDINGDGNKDLIVVGEWSSIMMFEHRSNGFVNITSETGIGDEVGWWYSIKSGDFDNDGDQDFIAGNLGLNNKFNASKEKPLHIFAYDFDESGTLDIVLSKSYKGELAPIRGKECSTDQMPFIGDKFPMFSDFASSTLEDIYGADNLNNALHYEVNNFASMYLENKGNGKFVMKQLPSKAQLAPINDMIVWDFDEDGNLDVIIAGNMFNTEVETPSYDAGKGLYLKGYGDGTFSTGLSVEESGIYLPKNVKNLELMFLSAEKRPAILAANNNADLQLFIWTR